MNSDAGELEGPAGFRALEFDLPSALLSEVVDVFEGMTAGALSLENASAIPNAQGVYQLFHDKRLVYVGKTDAGVGNTEAGAGLRSRVSRHAWTIQGRHNLSAENMAFKAVQVLVFSAMDLETSLITHYRKLGQTPAWNGSGFGSNDPGRQRDRTALREDGFDANYPINIDLTVDIPSIAESNCMELLARVAARVPYTVRHERSEEALAQLKNASVALAKGPVTIRSVMEEVCRALPPGWQATRLPGRMILYREYVDNYPGGEVVARSKGTVSAI